MFNELVDFEYLGHLHCNLEELGNLARGCTKIADLAGCFGETPILLKICERRAKYMQGQSQFGFILTE